MQVPTKEIKYDRQTRDFALYLDGDLVGYAGTYLEAETRLNSLVYAILSVAPAAAEPVTVEPQADEPTPAGGPAPVDPVAVEALISQAACLANAYAHNAVQVQGDYTRSLYQRLAAGMRHQLEALKAIQRIENPPPLDDAAGARAA